MREITLIGDCHSKYLEYLQICSQHNYTIQLGDLGYKNALVCGYTYPYRHKFITGNHDDHYKDYDLPHCLGRYGYSELNGVKFFFVSGGFSLDKDYRIKAFESGKWPQTWFPNEELSQKEGRDCLGLYESIKPDLVLTHEGPRSIIDMLFDRANLKNFGVDPETFTTSTGELLDQMLKIHRPRQWYFGHMHASKFIDFAGTKFRCLAELETWKVIYEEHV